MQTSLTDQMFQDTGPKSLTDQMFAAPGPGQVDPISYTFEPSDRSQPYMGAIDTAEQQYDLPKNMLARVIETESQFDPKARSPVGATGIAQIMPEHHPGVDPTDPLASIDYSAKYLKKLYDRFGDWDKALAAYNAGPSRVARGEELPEETRAYLEKINKHRVKPTVMPKGSLTDQMFGPEIEAPVEGPKDISKLQSELQRESVGEMVEEWPTGASPFYGTVGMKSVMGRSIEEYDEMKANPVITDRFKSEITETLSGYLELAKNPMEIIRGGAEFAMALPGFGLGILAAGKNMLERMGRPFDLDELYDAASEGMNETMEMWNKGMVEPLLGPPSPESQLVGSTVMAPALAIMAVGQAVAESESFKEYPNIRGLSRFAGDIGGLVALGRIIKGSRADITAKAEGVVRKAEQIVNREEMLKQTPDEAIKLVQQKILEIEKIQLELEATEVQKNLDYGKMIKEDLGRTQTQIKQIKQADKRIADVQIDKALERLPEDVSKNYLVRESSTEGYKWDVVEKKSGEIVDQLTKDELPAEYANADLSKVYLATGKEAKRKGLKVIEGKDRSKIEPTVEKADIEPSALQAFPEMNEVDGGGYSVNRFAPYEIKSFEEAGIIYTNSEGFEVVNASALWEGRKRIQKLPIKEQNRLVEESKAKMFEEPTTDLDLQTGTPEPPGLSTDKSPFRQTPEQTEFRKGIYDTRKSVAKNIDELISQDPTAPPKDVGVTQAKLTNDVNRYLEGEGIDIAATRNFLSELAARADELRMKFDDPADFANWKAGVSEAAIWARRADRGVDLPDRLLNMSREEFMKFEGLPGYPFDIRTKRGQKTQVEFLQSVTHDAETMSTLKDVRTLMEHDIFSYEDLVQARKAERSKIEQTLEPEVVYGKILERFDAIESDAWLSEFRKSERYAKTMRDAKEGFAEVESRLGPLADKKIEFIYHVRKTYNKTLEEAKDIADGLYSGKLSVDDVRAKLAKPVGRPGVELYSGLPLDAAAKEIVAGARKLADYTRKAKGMKAFKPSAITKILREGINRTVIDRSGNIRRDMLKALGEDGYRVIQKMYLAKGASSRSAMMLDQMRKEIYRGLSQNERRVLDNLILADRMIDIGKYKTPKQFKYPEEISPKNSVAYSELFQFIEKLSPEQAVDLRSKAKSYFEWMKKPLQDMLDAGLISKEEFDNLSSHQYRRIKLVEVYDKKYTAKVGTKKRTVYDSGVEALARGRDTDVFEPSSEIMALEVFNRAYGRIMNNEANKGLLEVARKDPNNPFVRVKEKKGDKIPTGWNRIFMYEEGQRKALYLSPEMSKEWITSSPETSYRFGQFLRYASASPVLRTFATGINWGFAVANLPRDIMHTWFTARTFEGGKWKPVYNPNLPIFALQIGRDLATVFTDAATKGKRYQDYIKEGGGMEFLVHQGRLFQRGRHIEGPLDAAYDFLGYFGETSEIMTRLAIRERLIRKGKSPQEATFAARDYMDFGQGGGIAKALDNAFPYLNAAVQGTRGLVRSFQPGSGSALSSTYKLAQLAGLTAGLYIAMSKMHPKSFENLKGNIDMQNNLCIPLGDSFGFEDEKGQTRYPYIKIPLDPGQKFFKTFFEACADKWLGNEIDVNRVVDSLKELSPVGVGELPPTVSGALGYMTNKDFWLNEDIWRKTEKPFGWPESKEEYIPGQTPQAMIDVGKLTGLSPERLKYAIEELVTGGSMWSYLLGQGYEELLGDLPEDKKQQHLAMALARIPVIKRFFGVTNPYSKYATVIDKAEEEVVIKRFTENRGFDVLVEGYLYEDNVERGEIFDYAKKFKDKDTYDRLVNRFKYEEAIKSLPERSFWKRLKGLTTEARAKVFVDRLNKSTPEEEQELWNEYAIVARAKGVISKSFREEVNKIRTYGPTPRVQVE